MCCYEHLTIEEREKLLVLKETMSLSREARRNSKVSE